jgi:hypothetical protein
MTHPLHDYPARFGQLVAFFRTDFYWYRRMYYRFSCIAANNDTVTYSTEMWSAICRHLCGKVPEDKDDDIWEEVLVHQRQLTKLDELIKSGYFQSQKAP